MRRKSCSDLPSEADKVDDDDDDDDDDVFVNVSAAKRQSPSSRSRVTSSCDVITPPSSISDVDVDIVNTAAVVCPGVYYILYKLGGKNPTLAFSVLYCPTTLETGTLRHNVQGILFGRTLQTRQLSTVTQY